jgi:hypothetical protein
MEEEAQGEKPVKRRGSVKPGYVFGIIAAIAILAGAAGGGYTLWKSKQPKSLLPRELASQEVNFLPYFYFDKIPANYTISSSEYNEANGALLVTFTRPGRASISLSEQRLSGGLDLEGLMRGGETVRGAAEPAIINKVPGRFVGIMADTDGKTLILFNAPNDADKQDLSDLIAGLKPLQ